MESKEEASSKVQSNDALKLYSVLWVSVLASTFGDSPSRLAPNSSLTNEFSESPFEPFCEIKIIKRNAKRKLVPSSRLQYSCYYKSLNSNG